MKFKLLKKRIQNQDQTQSILSNAESGSENTSPSPTALEKKPLQGIEPTLNLPFGWVLDQLTEPFRRDYEQGTSAYFSLHVQRHPDGVWEVHAIDTVSSVDVDQVRESESDLEDLLEAEEEKVFEEVALERTRNVLSSEKGGFHLGWKLSMRLHGFLLLVLIHFGSHTYAETLNYTLDPAKRISAEISQDSMNRIAIANDRITQVFGDTEAYEVQTDDATGQIFIKPTIENGDKPLSLTLITEKNITQDLSLLPSEREATTVILKNTQAPVSQNGEGGYGSFPPTMPQSNYPGWGVPPMMGIPPAMMGYGPRGGFGSGLGMGMAPSMMAQSYEDHLVNAMKSLTASGSLPAITLDRDPVRKNPEGVNVAFKAAYQVGAFKGYMFEIQNVSDTPMELKEEQFYQQDDLALSLGKHTLKKDETTKLYIVVR